MRPARFAAIATLLAATPLTAAPGKPVAVRFWGQGLVTIETYWNLTVAIDPYALRIGYDDPGIESDLVLVTHEHFDHNNVELIGGTPSVIRGLDDSGGVRVVDVVLDRAPNSPRASLPPPRKRLSAALTRSGCARSRRFTTTRPARSGVRWRSFSSRSMACGSCTAATLARSSSRRVSSMRSGRLMSC